MVVASKRTDCAGAATQQEKETEMRKIVAGLFLSLDGVFESPDRWHFPYFNDEMGQAIQSQMDASNTMLLERVTYQEFASFWPDQSSDEVPMANYMNSTPKVVVSTTLDTAEWKRSTLIKGNVAEELTRLKGEPGKDIMITGSGTLVRSLLRDDLLDELRLLIHPIVVGRGKRLFADEGKQTALTLVDATTFCTGVLSLIYQPARP